MLLSVGWFPLILALVSGPWSAPAFLPVTPSPMPTYHATPVRAGVLLAHSSVPVRLTAPLSSRNVNAGQHFSFVVARDVSAGGVVVIPRCTRGDGTVSSVGRHPLTGRGDLRLRFEALHPADGTTIALDPVEARVAGKYRSLTVPTDAALVVAVAEETYAPAVAPAPCGIIPPRIIAPAPPAKTGPSPTASHSPTP